MIKNNFFGQVLIATLVVFLLISSVQMFGWGLGIDTIELDQENASELPKVPSVKINTTAISQEDRKMMLNTINMRPMFSNSREPFKEDETNVAIDPADEPVPELKAQLTGVVITPEQSYAMILDTITNERDTYKVGMPLEGEQGGWTLNSIQSRKVVFVSDDDKTEELELAVHSGGLKTGAKPGKGNTDKKAQDKTANSPDKKEAVASQEDKKKNADDIRKKIAERRAQMRADAAKKQ